MRAVNEPQGRFHERIQMLNVLFFLSVKHKRNWHAMMMLKYWNKLDLVGETYQWFIVFIYLTLS